MSSARAIVTTYYAIGDTTALKPAEVEGDMSADIIGPTTTIDRVDQVCYQVSWTSTTAVGQIAVEASVNGINFEELTFTPPLAQPTANDGRYIINLYLLSFPYVRLRYTRTSGTGTMQAYLSAKGF